MLIGVGDDGKVIGLENDLPLVKPGSPDGLLNWLTTQLINALTHAVAMRTRARIDQLGGGEVCRVDVARSSTPVTARMSDGAEVFWVRMNNSTRSLPEIQVAQYVRDHWGQRLDLASSVVLQPHQFAQDLLHESRAWDGRTRRIIGGQGLPANELA